MPFDAITLAAATDDMRELAAGGRVQRIIQPSSTSVALSVYTRNARQWVLLSADPRYARAHLSAGRLAKAFATPSPFIMLLRKYLEGTRLSDVFQAPCERVLILTCAAPDRQARLVVETMGRHSNIILVDERDMVLGSLKTVSPRESRIRPIWPGRSYQSPPTRGRDDRIFTPGPRVDPHTEPFLFESLLSSVRPDISLRSALLGLLPGSGPFLADQVALRAGLDPGIPTMGVEPRAVREAADELYKLYETHRWQPCTFVEARGLRDFAPYIPLGVADIRKAPSMSTAIDECLGGEESRDAMGALRKSLLTEVERAQRSLERRKASLQEGLRASQEAESVMRQGQLLLAYQHRLVPRATELPIPEMDLTISLDPALSPLENAERTFHRYRKLRDAARKIPPLLKETEAEAARLADVAAFVRLATSEVDLGELSQEIRPQAAGEPGQNKKPKKRRGPLVFSLAGHKALVGRNARENEELTFRLARRDDLWLHARERTGAHVILRRGGMEPSEEILVAAASLAAYFSEGRADTRVDVDITPVRNVRKISAGPPGRVTYRSARTLRVEPRTEPWTPGKGHEALLATSRGLE